MRPALLPVFILLLASGLTHAAPASFTAGKGKLLCGKDGQQAATWTGACKDGVADGAGIATWTDGTTPNRLEGTLASGDVSGGATLTFGESKYIGTFQRFAPHGQGSFQYADGSMYEGGLDNGKLNGRGIFVRADRTRHEGGWLDGRREGEGKATFALGGSYDGHWHNDKFDGAGTIVYTDGGSWTGQFKEGRTVGGPMLLTTVQKPSSRVDKTTPALGNKIPADAAPGAR